MNRLALPALFALTLTLTACPATTTATKGTIPPGTPPPDYEAPREYDPSTAPHAAPSASPAAPAASPAPAPAPAPAAPKG